MNLRCSGWSPLFLRVLSMFPKRLTQLPRRMRSHSPSFMRGKGLSKHSILSFNV